MAWRRSGNKPLPEPMMAQFTDAYMCHPASMILVAVSAISQQTHSPQFHLILPPSNFAAISLLISFMHLAHMICTPSDNFMNIHTSPPWIFNEKVPYWHEMIPWSSGIELLGSEGNGNFACKGMPCFNTLGPRQNGCHLANIFKQSFVDIYEDWCIVVQKWLGAKQVTGHYLNQWWSSILRYIRHSMLTPFPWINSFPPDKIAASLADNIFKCIFLNENDRIQIQISLKLLPGVQLTISQHWFIVTNDNPVHGCIYIYMRH